MVFPESLAINLVQSYATITNSRLSDILVNLSGSNVPFASNLFADILALLTLRHFKLQSGKQEWHFRLVYPTRGYSCRRKSFDSSVNLWVTSACPVPVLALRSQVLALVPEVTLGSAENDHCCPLVVGHEASFEFSQMIFCHLWQYRFQVQS